MVIKRKAWWLSLVLVVAASVLWLWSAAVPGGDLEPLLWGVGLWVPSVAVWAVVTSFAWADLPRPRRRHVRALWPLLVVPTLSAATLAVFGHAERIAFELYRPALDRVASRVEAGEQVRDRLGPYDFVSSPPRPGACTMLFMAESEWGSNWGFARCPDVPRSGGNVRYSPVDGPWYEFVHSS